MLLGLDIGTGSCKALLLSEDGTVLREASATYAVNAPQPGYAETNPEDWFHAIVKTTQEIVGNKNTEKKATEITAIGLSGQMHGLVFTDANGQALHNAILWADARASQELKTYQQLSANTQARLKNPIVAGMMGPSLLWFKKHQANIFFKSRWALSPKDWLRMHLTGTANSEPSDASATLLYDIAQDTWDNTLIAELELRQDMFAPVVASTQICGTLTASAATALGLQAGIPVVAGGADTAVAMLGAGLIIDGELQLSIGTGAQIVAPTHQLHSGRSTHLYRSVISKNSDAGLPMHYAMAAMQNAGLVLEWVRKIFGVSWQDMYQQAFSVQSDGLIFLPYVSGERTPHLNPNARGAWLGLSLAHNQSQMLRAAFEGVAFAIRDGLDALNIGNKNALRLVGGGSLQTAWRQLLSDVLERPLLAYEISSASARGAALLAGIGTGLYTPQDTLTFTSKATLVAEPQENKNIQESLAAFRAAYQKIQAENVE